MDGSAKNLKRIRFGLIVRDISTLSRAQHFDNDTLDRVGLNQNDITALLTSVSQKLENVIKQLEDGISELEQQIELKSGLVSFKSVSIGEPETYPMFTAVHLNKRLSHALIMLDQFMIRLHQLYETGCISQVERNNYRKSQTSLLQRFLNETHKRCKDVIVKAQGIDQPVRESKVHG